MKFCDLFSYDAITGALLWKIHRPRRPVGSIAGNKKSDGRYFTVHATIQGVQKRYYVHRVIWEMHHGPIESGMCIDHIDGDGLNNRLENLRLVTLSDNQRNSRLPRNNRLGVHGVYQKARGYAVQCAGRYVGFYGDFFEACCARMSAESRMGFHHNHGRL